MSSSNFFIQGENAWIAQGKMSRAISRTLEVLCTRKIFPINVLNDSIAFESEEDAKVFNVLLEKELENEET